jgi:Fic family protein
MEVVIMNYISVKEATNKWNISERRIRCLLEANRIDGAIKIGNTWSIPFNALKPYDKRYSKNNNNFIINIGDDYYKDIDQLKTKVNELKLSKDTLNSLTEEINLEWIFNSNGIEGNTLTMHETKVVLEGITVGGKSVREHLEVINHREALNYFYDLLKDNSQVNERMIKDFHALILRDIDRNNAGLYRKENVLISGAKHLPPDYTIVPELMEKLLLNYNNWNKYHPIIKAALLHGEFVKIHPFIDGNGRTSRLLMNYVLMMNGYQPVIIKKDNRLKYYEALDKAHNDNDYTDFIKIIVNEEVNTLNMYLLLCNK